MCNGNGVSMNAGVKVETINIEGDRPSLAKNI